MARTPKVVEDRREQIIEAAIRVFAQKGFTRATNKDIAREAGITPGLIYHYFESKEAVLKAIIEGRSPLKVLKSMPEQTLALPPNRFLRLLIGQILHIVESDDFVQLIRVFLPEAIHNSETSPIGAAVLQEATKFLAKYLATKMASGELKTVDAVLAAQALMGCVIGFVLRRQILRDPMALSYTQEQIIDVVVSTALEGLFPR
jgi:AcrR family transcriptional regulator